MVPWKWAKRGWHKVDDGHDCRDALRIESRVETCVRAPSPAVDYCRGSLKSTSTLPQFSQSCRGECQDASTAHEFSSKLRTNEHSLVALKYTCQFAYFLCYVQRLVACCLCSEADWE